MSVPVAIPDVSGMSVRDAALAYASCGLAVFPVNGKQPRVDKGVSWKSVSSADPGIVEMLFPSGCTHGVAVDMEKSRLIAIDVDYPDKVPQWMWGALATAALHKTRIGFDGRGHYVFRQPEGEAFGDSVGDLPKGFGEVKGSGYIVLAPSPHVAAEDGGRYEWAEPGQLAVLPSDIQQHLRAKRDRDGDGVSVEEFIARHNRSEDLGRLTRIVSRFDPSEGSRHDSMLKLLGWAMRWAAAGYFPAGDAVDALRSVWDEGTGDTPGRDFGVEFDRMVNDTIGDVDEAAVLRERLDNIADPFSGEAMPASSLSLDLVTESPATDKEPTSDDLFDVMTEADYLDMPDPKILVEDLIAERSLVRIYGKSNHGKSFVVQDLMWHMASGKPSWHGRAIVTTPVMYIPYEGISGIKNRLRAWMNHHGVDSFEGRFMSPTTLVHLRDAGGWEKLIRTAAHHEVKVVILDTQSQATAGMDENSAQEMSEVVKRLSELLRGAGASVWVVAHMGHQGDHARGSTAVLAGMDTELRVTKQEDGSHTVLSTKQREIDTDAERGIHLRRLKVGKSAVLVSLDEKDTSELFTQVVVTDDSPQWMKLAKIIYETSPDEDGITRAEAIGNTMKEYKIANSNRPNIGRAWRYLYDNNRLVETLDDREKGTGKFVVTAGTVRELGLTRSACH